MRVRVAPPHLEQMRGEGLVGPFSRIRLVEDGDEPRLELTVDPAPTPDTVEWWRAVAQELATEIHKLKEIALSATVRPSGEDAAPRERAKNTIEDLARAQGVRPGAGIPVDPEPMPDAEVEAFVDAG